VDFWNFGCLLYELFTGKSPFNTQDEFRLDKLYTKILKGVYQIPVFVPEDAADLIVKLLEVNPAKRLGANGVDEVKSHHFFNGVDWNLLLKNNRRGPLNVRYEKAEIKLRALNVNLDDMVSDDKTIELANFSYNETPSSPRSGLG